MKQYDELRLNKHVNVEQNRMNWCTHANIRHMYAHLYKDWSNKGYIVPLKRPHFQDQYRNEVDIMDESRVGYQVCFQWKYPDRMLMADEVGHNTCMAIDCVSAGDKAICHVGSVEIRYGVRCNE